MQRSWKEIAWIVDQVYNHKRTQVDVGVELGILASGICSDITDFCLGWCNLKKIPWGTDRRALALKALKKFLDSGRTPKRPPLSKNAVTHLKERAEALRKQAASALLQAEQYDHWARIAHKTLKREGKLHQQTPDIWRAARMEHAFLLRCEGMSYKDIGVRLDCTGQNARILVFKFQRRVAGSLSRVPPKFSFYKM